MTISPFPKSVFCALALFNACASANEADDPLLDENRPVAKTEALKPEETAAQMKVPAGFRVELVAGEPQIVQPIAFTFDDRGRLWVVENTNYPDCPGTPKDRVLVLESTRGDGRFDKQTVFWDKATFTSGLAVGFGGVWLGSPPNLVFIPDKDGDLIPDGAPENVLDGWGADDTHETLNDFIWGPDGWLYGTQGIFTHSKVGRPGAADGERVPINGGVWRYHPTRKIFERWAEGVSNQWGLDWNDHGEAFFAACVIPHMWHGIEGAHYQRQSGAHFNPHLYEDIQTIAWGRYEKAAYCGAMIYLGGAFPAEWRDKMFFHDIHMNNLRCERLVRDGSGFRSERVTDFLTSPDAWFRGLSPQYGPDGSVFLNDWYDKVPCHQQKDFTDRTNGRIYRITSDAVKPAHVDLTTASDADLVKMQLDPNDWFVRHARRLLQERGANPATTAALEKILFENEDDTRQLRALWTLHGQRALSEASALRALAAKSEHVRGWTVTSVCEEGRPSAALLETLVELAKNDPSPLVRLRLSSAAQRLEIGPRWPLLEALASHAEDAADRNLPLMVWYAAEGAVAAEPVRGVALLREAKLPKLHEFIARRVTALAIEDEAKASAAMEALSGALADAAGPMRRDILRGMLAALKGRPRLAEPRGWDTAYAALRTDADASVREDARKLALIFGSKAALDELRALMTDGKAPVESRRAAIESLAVQRDAASLDALVGMLARTGPLRAAALRALAVFDDAGIAPRIIEHYSALDADEQRDALNTLTARPPNTRALLAAMDENRIPRQDLTAPLARVIQGFKQPEFDAWLEKNWGSLKASSAEKQSEIARYKKFLGTDAILHADVKHGREIYQVRCAVCHTMFGQGGKIGPELPGSFTDLEYLLTNILDPNAFIGKDYQQVFITTKSGELHAGVVTAEDANSITLKTLAAPVTVPRAEIKSVDISPMSMMPEGLMSGLEEPEVRDLLLYLRQANEPPAAPPVPAAAVQSDSPAARLAAYRAELDVFRNTFGGARDLPDVRFFLFGMGQRAKFIYRDGKLLDAATGTVVREWPLGSDTIVPPDYEVALQTTGGATVTIREDEEAVWIQEDGKRTAVDGTRHTVKLPAFEGKQFPRVLRVLHQELLVNVTPAGPVPNFFVYQKPWYRDGAMMALAFKETGNLDVIRDWILGLREVFDRNNKGETEADNLGQALFLVSLVADKTHPLVERVLAEIPRFEVAGEGGKSIKGRSDFQEHPAYQTKWLKYGLRALGLPDPYTVPRVVDGYSALFWMDYKDTYVAGKDSDDRGAYPYLGWACDHFHSAKKSPVGNRDYPLTWEQNASEANYDGLKILDPIYVQQKLSAPHTWHAAEVFLMLLNELAP